MKFTLYQSNIFLIKRWKQRRIVNDYTLKILRVPMSVDHNWNGFFFFYSVVNKFQNIKLKYNFKKPHLNFPNRNIYFIFLLFRFRELLFRLSIKVYLTLSQSLLQYVLISENYLLFFLIPRLVEFESDKFKLFSVYNRQSNNIKIKLHLFFNRNECTYIIIYFI